MIKITIYPKKKEKIEVKLKGKRFIIDKKRFVNIEKVVIEDGRRI